MSEWLHLEHSGKSGRRSRVLDLAGHEYGKLTVKSYHGRGRGNHGSVLWNVECKCGEKTIATTHDLRRGDTRSCGCLQGQSHVRMLTIDGITKSVCQWEDDCGFRRGVIKDRLRIGWKPNRAITEPVKFQNRTRKVTR